MSDEEYRKRIELLLSERDRFRALWQTASARLAAYEVPQTDENEEES